jgi:hypothetical protein
MHIVDTLHRVGLTIILISIVVHIAELIVVSRHLAEPSWLSSFNKITPYAVWAGMLLVFAGIVMRDRSWTSRRPGSN